MELHLNRLPDESVHVAGLSREDLGVLEFNEVILSESMFLDAPAACGGYAL
jgi:hypothetical protein